MIFTTVDQLLSRYLMAPYGGRPANISAGALVGAHIVLDEFHLYPEDEARLTAIAMLDHLRGLSSAVVMTATLPEKARVELSDVLGAGTIAVTVEQMEASGDRPRPRRSWSWRHEALNAAAAISAWKDAGAPPRVLVCANTVARAQALFGDLRGRLPPATASVLVHARFLPRDRDLHEAHARAWLGRSAEKPPTWIVATQVIEAGLDASADVLLTELAPASSLVQRAGRCARWPRSKEEGPTKGSVVIFRDPALQSFKPYEADVVEATWAARREVPAEQGATFESDLVEAAHGATDLASIRALRGRLSARREAIRDCIDAPDPSARWQLVRNISSQAVLVRRAAASIDLARMPDTISVAGASLRQLLADPAALADAAIPRQVPETGDMSHTADAWERPTSLNAAMVAELVVLSPDYAAYSSDVGLLLRTPGPESPLSYAESSPAAAERFRYHKDTFEAHIGRCVFRARQFLQNSHAALRRLSEPVGLAASDLAACVRLAVALHDTGKTSAEWQSWATAHQKALHHDVVTLCLAHTDFDPGDPLERARARGVRPLRPPHAAEGAVLARDIVASWVASLELDADLAATVERSILGAIARHHSARAKQAAVCRTDGRGRECIERALRCAGHDPALAAGLALRVGHVEKDLELNDLLPSTGHTRGDLEVLLYATLARIVRLADQHSFDPIRPPEVRA